MAQAIHNPRRMTSPIHSPAPHPSMPLDIRAGHLAVTLAKTAEEVEAAQRLRHRFFSTDGIEDGIDRDAYDTECDHLLVKDMEQEGTDAQVVGTYRLIRQSAMQRVGRYYSESEFDLTALKRFTPALLELGRSCVKEQYRSRAVMQLLWRGIGAYVAHHNIELMFGCASFAGTDPQAHAEALSYLHHFHMAPEHLRAHALPATRLDIDLVAKEEINPTRAFIKVPPLIKGYLRLGGFIGDGAFIDRECGTIDVCIVVQSSRVTEKYVQRYGNGEEGLGDVGDGPSFA